MYFSSPYQETLEEEINNEMIKQSIRKLDDTSKVFSLLFVDHSFYVDLGKDKHNEFIMNSNNPNINYAIQTKLGDNHCTYMKSYIKELDSQIAKWEMEHKKPAIKLDFPYSCNKQQLSLKSKYNYWGVPLPTDNCVNKSVHFNSMSAFKFGSEETVNKLSLCIMNQVFSDLSSDSIAYAAAYDLLQQYLSEQKYGINNAGFNTLVSAVTNTLRKKGYSSTAYAIDIGNILYCTVQ